MLFSLSHRWSGIRRRAESTPRQTFLYLKGAMMRLTEEENAGLTRSIAPKNSYARCLLLSRLAADWEQILAIMRMWAAVQRNRITDDKMAKPRGIECT